MSEFERESSWVEGDLRVSRVTRDGSLSLARAAATGVVDAVRARLAPSTDGAEYAAARRADVEAAGDDALGDVDPGRVLVLGDTHGDELEVATAVVLARALGASVVLSVGDFGVAPDALGARFLDVASAASAATGVEVRFVDGNHDDHEALAAARALDSGVRPLRRGVGYLPRGHRWTWLGASWGALGGALSPNREDLTPGLDYWPTERPTAADAYRLGSDPLDVLVTHEAPGAYRVGRRPLRADLEAEAREDRRLVDAVLTATGAGLGFHGHHHAARRTAWWHPDEDGVETLRTYYGLGRDGSGEDAYLLVERA